MSVLLALIAGLATGLGGIIALLMKNVKNFGSVALGMAGGVMIYVAFAELYPAARTGLSSVHANGELLAAVAFLGGASLMALLGRFVPERGGFLGRAGLFTFIAIALHNLPEGVAMYLAGASDARLGASVCVAIALHNIPEGIAIAAPLYALGRNGKRAVLAAAACGSFEVLGVLLGSAFAPMFTPFSQGMMMAVVTGVMVFLSLAEIIPSAARENSTFCCAALLAGMGVMALALAIG